MKDVASTPASPSMCPQCNTELAPAMLACPRCARLVHTEELTRLAESARAATERGDYTTALGAWRDALTLLPHNARQHQVIAAKITELGAKIPYNAVPTDAPSERSGGTLRAATGLGVIGLTLWKLKSILFGLTKASTLFSMLVSLGAYWTLWGWKFAAGIILSIYVHEMGHVIALRRYGFRATAPMFIPGLGAVVRLKQQVVNPLEDAVIGLAGPIYGLGAALAALSLWLLTAEPIFAAIAGVGAWINLFNLLPLGPLDGGRGFHAMSRLQRLIATVTLAGGWIWTHDGLLMLLAFVAAFRVIGDRSDNEGSWKTTVTYSFLVLTLAALSTIRGHIDLGS